MTYYTLKHFLRKYWLCYFFCSLILFGLKLFYRQADCSALEWILAPTARWVSILTGISFEPLPGAGYVNHSLRFLIAPSCSGVRFLIITFATLSFSFLPHMGSIKKELLWIAASLGIAYPFTIFVNGIRISLSIELPVLLSQSGQEVYAAGMSAGLFTTLLTPERLHTAIGITVYFTSLFLIYRITAVLLQVPSASRFCRIFPPLFWYLALTLGIPLLRRAYRSDVPAFLEYALLLLAICSLILLLTALLRRLLRH